MDCLEVFSVVQLLFADKQEPYGDITHTSDSEGYIHFDPEGNIVESNLESNTNKKARPAINHASGRWVYFSELYDWGRGKKDIQIITALNTKDMALKLK